MCLLYEDCCLKAYMIHIPKQKRDPLPNDSESLEDQRGDMAKSAVKSSSALLRLFCSQSCFQPGDPVRVHSGALEKILCARG